MYPDLLKFLNMDGFSLPSYFTLIAVGYIIAVWLFWKESRRQGVNPDDALDFGLWMIVWGVIGARLLHVVADGFFWDYVHLCTDPFLVEGRDLLGRPASELSAMGLEARSCTSDLQCEASLWGYSSVEKLEAAKSAGALDGLCVEPGGRDVGPVCNEETGLCHPEQDCFRWANFMAGGLAFYGGFLGATLFAVYFTIKNRMGALWMPSVASLKKTGLSNLPLVGPAIQMIKYIARFPRSFFHVADMAAPPLVLAHAFGRIGCFLGGCCFGEVSEVPWAVRFPQWSAAHRLHRKEHADALGHQFELLGEHSSLLVHPTQLYEVVFNLLIFSFLFFFLRKRKKFHGQIFSGLLICYALARFVIEFFRADMRGEWFGFSTSQWIALMLFGLGMWIFSRLRKGNEKVIDDGNTPPCGIAPHEGILRPPLEDFMWEGEVVAPVEGWLDEQKKLEDRIAGREN